MECQIRVLISLVCVSLFIIPAFFYIYERWAKMPRRWCTYKAIMLFAAMLICVGLALPALRSIAFLVCR